MNAATNGVVAAGPTSPDPPMLFAETPRAGRWNHRFLVPESLSLSEEQLAEQAARARRRPQGANYLAVVRSVEQPATGRAADELLVLHGVEVERLDAATRRVLLKRLAQRLEDLEQLVEALDWEQEGKRLVVHRRELKEWFDADFAPELAACRGPSPLPESQRDPDAAPKRGWRLPLSGLILLAIAISVWRPWDTAGPPESVNGRPDSPVAPEPVAAPHAGELAEVEPVLRQLAERWRLPERRDSPERVCQAVVDRLEQDLLLSPVDPTAPASQRLASFAAALATHLLSQSQRGAATPLEQFADDGFQRRLLSLYGADGLDYAAPLRSLIAPNDYDRQEQLRSLLALCSPDDKRQVSQFRALTDAAKTLTLEASGADVLVGDTDLVRQLHEAARASATLRWAAGAGEHAPSGLQLSLLSEQDAADAAVLLTWLRRAGLSTAGGAEDEVVAEVRQFVRDKRDVLEALATQEAPGRRAHAIQCAKLLLQLDRHLASRSS
ncbi:MAG: hypothetical protein KDB14_09665 [Planctomycetales bacterium]|nr:hypothetical protein [Planctomycetales bacterium]